MRILVEAMLVVLCSALVAGGAITLRFVGYEYGHGDGAVVRQLFATPEPDTRQTSL